MAWRGSDIPLSRVMIDGEVAYVANSSAFIAIYAIYLGQRVLELLPVGCGISTGRGGAELPCCSASIGYTGWPGYKGVLG
jgi:hypothetical protein